MDMRFKRQTITGVFIFIFAVIVSCDAVNESPKSTIDDIAFDLEITPHYITHTGVLNAVYTIQNNSGQTIEMVSGCTELATGIVSKEEQVIGLIGSGDACYTAISTHEIPPGEKFEYEWHIKPFEIRYYPDDREPDTTFADLGEYTFTVIPQVYEINKEQGKLPELERTFAITKASMELL